MADVDAELVQRIARLETAEQVRALAAAYADACDANDLDAIRAITAPDVVVSVPGRQWTGVEEVLGFYRAAWGEHRNPSRHFMTNVAMTALEPDRAEATSSFLYVAAIDGASKVGWGSYRDTFTRVGGVLVLQSKHIEMDLLVDLDQGWAQALGQLAAARSA